MLMLPAYPLFLASRSPRRKLLLAQLGVDFQTLDVEVEECPMPDESPEDYVRRVAREKAWAGRDACSDPAALVLGADTEVVVDGRVTGKPVDRGDARRMLRALSGRTHRVLSAVTLVGPRGIREALSETMVEFAPIDAERIERYLDSGEYADKAGAYAIQGMAGGFISRIDGSYSGVMGLPLYETAALLEQSELPLAVDIPAHPVP